MAEFVAAMIVIGLMVVICVPAVSFFITVMVLVPIGTLGMMLAAGLGLVLMFWDGIRSLFGKQRPSGEAMSSLP